MPAIAAAPGAARSSPEHTVTVAGHVVAEPDRADDVDHDDVAVDRPSTTEPVKLSVSPGYAGAPSRSAIDRTSALGAGPVGDVPLHEPVGGQDVEEDVLRPVRRARSRSWWTSWKSRVAMAVLTTSVGVIGELASSGSWSPTLRRSCAPPDRQGQLVVDPSKPATTRQPDLDLVRARSRRAPPSIRTPSSRSTSASRIGSSLARAPAGAGARRTRTPCPRPSATTWPRSNAWHAGHDGPGRVAQRAAGRAPLDPQLAGRGAVPEERGVPVHRDAAGARVLASSGRWSTSSTADFAVERRAAPVSNQPCPG